jgi:hypothetical protein
VKITVEVLFIVLAKEPKKDEMRCVDPSFRWLARWYPGGCLDRELGSPRMPTLREVDDETEGAIRKIRGYCTLKKGEICRDDFRVRHR